MTDQQSETEAPAKRPPGRPRKAPPHVKRQPVHKPMRSGSDEPDIMEGFEYRPFQHENPLSIDPDIVRSIEREWGHSLRSVCFEANGKPFPKFRQRAETQWICRGQARQFWRSFRSHG